MSDASQLSEREQQLNAILADYLEAQRLGQAPTRAELLARHPDLADELAGFLDDQAALNRLSPGATPAPFAETVSVPPGVDCGETPRVDAPVQAPSFGDYELLAEIARGGMGVVFKARQIRLNRVVALKMILAGQFASDAEVQRFRAEARSAAHLDHPNIVPIYEVGDHAGHQYFSMKLVEGGSLAEAIARCRTGSADFAAQAVRLLVQVARAVHHAHQHRLLHRDLKPANILLQFPAGADPAACDLRSAVPHVTDFGLAKSVGGDDRLTRSGVVVGTPSYMAPEQALGTQELTTLADVYALGAILYESLTGRPPFRGASMYDTLRLVREEEPAPPRSVVPGIDRDLETICLKCLRKEPARRYESAAALADDLQRWLDGLPILARPAGSGERVVKWARRRPTVAALGALLAVVTPLGLGGIVWKWQDALAAEQDARTAAKAAQKKAEDEQSARREEAQARRRESEAKEAALKAEAREREARKEADRRRGEAEEARKQALADRDAKQKAFERADGLRLSAEAGAARVSDPGLALLLAVEGVRRAPNRLTFASLYAAMQDCREERVMGDGGREERGWHIFEKDAKSLTLFPDGKRLLAVAGASFRVYDWQTGKMLQEWKGYNLPINSVALSPDRKRVALTADGYSAVGHSDGKTYHYTDRLAYVIDLAANQEVLRLRGAGTTVHGVAWSPDGSRILTASDDGKARIYDAANGKLLHQLNGHDKALLQAHFSADGRHVVTVGRNYDQSGYGYEGFDKNVALDPDFDPQVRPFGLSGRGRGSLRAFPDKVVACWWDAATGKQLATFNPPAPAQTKDKIWYPADATVSQGEHPVVAIAMNDVVAIWDPAAGKVVHLKGHDGAVSCVAFSPRGDLLATGSADRSVRLWDAATGREAARLRGPQGDITGVRFDGAGKRILARSADKTVRVWDVSSGIEQAALRGHGGSPVGAEFAPDGSHVVSAGDNTFRVWRLDPPPTPDVVLRHGPGIRSLAYSPDGKYLLTAGQDETARLWDTATGKHLRVVGQGRGLGEVRSARFSPDGKRVITASAFRSVTGTEAPTTSAVNVWDVETGKELLALKDLETGASAALFSPDGRLILTVSDGAFRVKRVDGEETKKDQPKKEMAPKAPGGSAKLADWVDFLGALASPPKVTFHVETQNSEKAGVVQVWNVRTGKLLATLPHARDLWGQEREPPAFTPDSQGVLYYDPVGKRVNIYEARTGKEIQTYRGQGQWGKVVAHFSPDGRWVGVGQQDTLVLFDTRSGAQSGRFTGFPGNVEHFAFDRAGTRLAAATGQTVFVWELPSRKLLVTLKGHEGAVNAVAFTDPGDRVLTASADGTAAVWDAADGKMLALFKGHTGGIKRIERRPDGKQLATLGEDDTARLWPADLRDFILARRTRDFTTDERKRFELPGKDGKPIVTWEDRLPVADPPAGAALPEPFRLERTALDPAAARDARARLDAVRQEAVRPGADAEPLRRRLLELREKHPASDEATEAARLLTTLTSPLDALDPARVAAGERQPGQPKELVAVLGEHARRHRGWISAMEFSPSGRLLASYGGDRLTRLWDAATLEGHGSIAGQFLGFIGQDELLIEAGNETAERWDVSGPQPVKRAEIPHPAVHGVRAASPDGKWLFGYGPGWTRFVLADASRTPVVTADVCPKANDQYLHAATFSPDGKLLALAFDRPNEVRVYDVAGRPALRFAVPFPKDAPLVLSFSPDGRTLLATTGSMVIAWDATAKQPAERFQVQAPRGGLSVLRLTPDGQTLFTGGHWEQARVWGVGVTPAKDRGPLPGSTNRVGAIAVSPDGRRVAVAERATVRLWEQTDTGFREPRPPVGHLAPVGSVAFSPDDRTLLTADDSDTVRLWGLGANGFSERQTLPDAGQRALWLPGGKGMVSGTLGCTVWNVRGTEARRRAGPFDHHNHGPASQALSADGRVLVRGRYGPALTVLDLAGPAPRLRTVLQELGDNGVGSVTVSPDGRYVAATSFGYNQPYPVRIWKVTEDGLKPLAFPWAPAQQVAFSPDGRRLATSYGAALSVWDLTRTPAAESVIESVVAGQKVNHLAFSPDGQTLLCTSGSELGLWDVGSKKARLKLTLPGEVESAGWAHDGRHLAAGNQDGTIYVLRVGARGR